jgi:uncharacterized protein
MKKCGFLGVIAVIILIIGGLNWGLVGLFGFNLVEYLFSTMPLVVRLIYIIVGLAALYKIFVLFKYMGNKDTA